MSSLDFENDNVDYGTTGLLQIGDFTFKILQQSSSTVTPTDTPSFVTWDMGDVAWAWGLGGKVLGINPTETYLVNGFEFQSTSLANDFKLAGMGIVWEAPAPATSYVLNFTGYQGGSAGGTVVAQGSIDLKNPLASSGGVFVQSQGMEPSVVGAWLYFGGTWSNVDTIVVTAPGAKPLGPLRVSIDNIDLEAAEPIQTATYDAASGTLVVNGLGIEAGATVEVDKLRLRTGIGTDEYQLTSANVVATAGQFTVLLNESDKLAANGLYGANGKVSQALVADAGWIAGAPADFDNEVSISNVAQPAITSATYNVATHVLTVTCTNLVAQNGSDIYLPALTLSGEGNVSHTLSYANVEVASSTSFSVTLSPADRALVEPLFNKNGSTSTSGIAYNLAAADGWNRPSGYNTGDAANPVTVEGVSSPAISAASYDTTTGRLVVTGTGFVVSAGAANDIDPTRLTINGDGGASYTLTGATAAVEITSATSFTLMLGTADRDALKAILNNNGTASLDGDTFTITAASGWLPGSALPDADASGDPVAVSGIVRPRVTWMGFGDRLLNASETTTVTINFSEPVTGLTEAAFTVQNGTIGAPSSADGGLTWTATLTPAANTAASGNHISVSAAHVLNAAGYAGRETYISDDFAIDTITPTATITIADTDLKAGETTSVSVRFSEAMPHGFATDHITFENGTFNYFTSSDGGYTWTATFTPAPGVSSSTNTITLDMAGVVDEAGNAASGMVVSANYSVQTVRPTASIVVADTQLLAGETSPVTITFSEPVLGLSTADFTVGNGALSGLSSTDGGITWTATLTPSANAASAANTLVLNNGGYMNAAGNTGSGSTTSNSYAVETQRPTASIVLSDANLKAGDTAQVTITFSEAVTGFTIASLSAGNGSISGLATADNITYTATLTPATNATSAINFVEFDTSLVTDGAGNHGTGTTRSASYAVDTVAPTATIAMNDTALLAGERATVTISFSEAVTGLAADDFTLSNGSLGALASSDGGRTWTAVLTPDANVSAASNAISFDPSGVADLAGNAGAGSPATMTYSVQTVRPTATITIDKDSLATGASATVTIVFSEAVTGLGVSDFSAPNATLKNLVSTDGGITWTATLTPRPGVTDTTNVLSLALAGVTNAAGNTGTGAAVSDNYAVSTGTGGSGGGSSGGGTPTSIDGVPATIASGTDPHTGLAVEVLTIRPVGPNRADDPSSPNAGLADIPLGVKGADGASIGLTVSLPIGAGLTASGPAAALTHASALTDLLQRIGDAANGAASANDMAAKGTAFLDSLAPGTLIETKTLAFSGGAGGPLQPLHVTGTAPQPGTAVALVIDTTSLPAGAQIQLDNVEFAAVVGAATLRGGDGRQFVTADDASQNIYLGADDDELHAGGGDDVVGSGGGNDLVDGGAGNDFVYGGTGNDTVLGGTGDDIVLGGRSDAGQWKFFIDAQGTVTARHENAAVAPGSWEDVAASELDANAPGLAFLKAGSAHLKQLALLYDAAFGRAADVQGLGFWAGYAGTAGETMAYFMQAAEYSSTKYAGLGDDAFVRAVYANVLGREADAAGLAFWTAKLQEGSTLSRSDILAAFALSAEHAAGMTKDGQLTLAAATNAGQAQWFAGSGDDRLDGGAGSDLLVGGDGMDTVVYQGARSGYRIMLAQDGSIRVSDTATGDVDTLYGIERGEFADGTVDLGFTQAGTGALQALGLVYHTVLGRTADIGGMNFWLAQAGDALNLARYIVATSEFQSRYAGADDAAFAGALFTNTGLQSSQAGGIGYWTDYAHSHSRAETVAAWIANAEVIGAQFGTSGLWLV